MASALMTRNTSQAAVKTTDKTTAFFNAQKLENALSRFFVPPELSGGGLSKTTSLPFFDRVVQQQQQGGGGGRRSGISIEGLSSKIYHNPYSTQ